MLRHRLVNLGKRILVIRSLPETACITCLIRLLAPKLIGSHRLTMLCKAFCRQLAVQHRLGFCKEYLILPDRPMFLSMSSRNCVHHKSSKMTMTAYNHQTCVTVSLWLGPIGKAVQFNTESRRRKQPQRKNGRNRHALAYICIAKHAKTMVSLSSVSFESMARKKLAHAHMLSLVPCAPCTIHMKELGRN